MKKVSIITVSFNSAGTIRDTLESVLEQDYENIEYIVIDGASTDDTMKIVREYEDRIALVICESDKGIYDAMNKGIEAATGEIVGLLNSDDFYTRPTAVSELIAHMEKNFVDMVFADLVIVAPRNPNKVVRYYDSSRFRPGKMRFGWMPAHPTLMIKRSLYSRIGLFRLDYKIAADFEMLVRLFCVARASYAYLPSVVIKMRAGGISTSGIRSSWILNTEIVRACRSNGIRTNLFFVLTKLPLKLFGLLKRPAFESRS